MKGNFSVKTRKLQENIHLKLKVSKMIDIELDAKAGRIVLFGVGAVLFAIAFLIICGGVALIL